MAIVYKGRVFSVEVERRKFPNGQEHEVAIVRHPPSVVLVPIADDGRVVLIRQYRASVSRELWEIPAGSVDEGETPDQAAARECEEEIALVPKSVRRMRSFYPTPGFCDEEMIFFRCTDLQPPAADSTVTKDEDEDIEARTFMVDEARRLVIEGEIVDLKTAVGLTLI